MTVAANGAGNAYPSGAPALTSGLCGGSCLVLCLYGAIHCPSLMEASSLLPLSKCDYRHGAIKVIAPRCLNDLTVTSVFGSCEKLIDW